MLPKLILTARFPIAKKREDYENETRILGAIYLRNDGFTVICEYENINVTLIHIISQSTVMLTLCNATSSLFLRTHTFPFSSADHRSHQRKLM